MFPSGSKTYWIQLSAWRRLRWWCIHSPLKKTITDSKAQVLGEVVEDSWSIPGFCAFFGESQHFPNTGPCLGQTLPAVVRRIRYQRCRSWASWPRWESSLSSSQCCRPTPATKWFVLNLLRFGAQILQVVPEFGTDGTLKRHSLETNGLSKLASGRSEWPALRYELVSSSNKVSHGSNQV